MTNADIILQSSDLVNFRVHRSALVASSPFFEDMLSLPQPPNDASTRVLPVVCLSEDAEVLNSLVSIMYPIPPEMPHSSDNILVLLAAAGKYDMDVAQSSICAEINQKGLLSSTIADAFRVYAVACGPSKMWTGCPAEWNNIPHLPALLKNCLWLSRDKTMKDKLVGSTLVGSFTNTILAAMELCDTYLKTLRKYVREEHCDFCVKVYVLEGEEYCEALKRFQPRRGISHLRCLRKTLESENGIRFVSRN